MPYTLLAPIGIGRLGAFRELVEREIGLLRVARKFKPDIMTGTSVNIARVARMIGSRSVVVNEDDASVVPLFRLLAYPFATAIVTPVSLASENYGRRHLTYPSYQKLFYLHPNRFTPDPSIRKELGVAAEERYAVVRTSALKAHHDARAQGLSADLIRRVLDMVRGNMRIFISSEKDLESAFAEYRITVPHERMHHVLAYAEFFIGDSQSMTMEAALLGTPAFRLSSFAGRITVIRELEEYGLAFGFRPGGERRLTDELGLLLSTPDIHGVMKRRREVMLSEKIDPLPWFLRVLDLVGRGHAVEDIRRMTLEEGYFHLK